MGIFMRIAAALLAAAGLYLTLSAKDFFAKKPAPDEVFTRLVEGNRRFVEGHPRHPHADAARRVLAAEANQAGFAGATILSCADSRVPVELIFDSGIMDLFVMRTAGNVCPAEEVGTIEYGVDYVNTPVLIVLGHTDCGAVKTTLQWVLEQQDGIDSDADVDQVYSRNILGILEPIAPAVRRILKENPEVTGEALERLCIEENVYIEVENLLKRSKPLFDAALAEKIKIYGGVYDIRTGQIKWLDKVRTGELIELAGSAH